MHVCLYTNVANTIKSIHANDRNANSICLLFSKIPWFHSQFSVEIAIFQSENHIVSASFFSSLCVTQAMHDDNDDSLWCARYETMHYQRRVLDDSFCWLHEYVVWEIAQSLCAEQMVRLTKVCLSHSKKPLIVIFGYVVYKDHLLPIGRYDISHEYSRITFNWLCFSHLFFPQRRDSHNFFFFFLK